MVSRTVSLRSRLLIPALSLIATAILTPQAALAQAGGTTLGLLRTATGDGAYHYAQVIHERGRWVALDVGYIDFSRPSDYFEAWIGSGVVAAAGERGVLITQANLVRAFGDLSGDALYAQGFILGKLRLSDRVVSEAAYLPYIPLNDAGEVQHLLERAKIEVELSGWKAGAGYGAYRFSDQDWQHKPFLTATAPPSSLGTFEVWLQRLPGDGNTVQLRWVRAFGG
jgi:hypothetical protein